MDKIRVLLVEDERLLRETMAELLSLQDDMEVVGQAADGGHALKVARAQEPHVVLTDLEMPEMDGIKATTELRAMLPATSVVVLTNHAESEMVFAALKAGAIGYVVKSAAMPEVLAAVRAASRGEGWLHPSLVPRVLEEFTRLSSLLQKHKEVFSELTRREVEILEMLASGRRNRDIAEELFLSERTVKNHVSSILSKLHVNSRTEAAVLANKYHLG